MGKAEEIISRLQKVLNQTTTGKRKDSDEAYVINLCDEVLKLTASRQHKFGFLLGDVSPTTGKKAQLPVDAYYEEHKLVVEYNERQHTESVALFDRKKTISGMSRGEQRKMYDERRKKVLPEHGIDLITISYFDFGSSKKLLRNKEHDIQIVKKKLAKYITKITTGI